MKRLMLAVVALLVALAPVAEAGRLAGPGVDMTVVLGNSTDVYTVTFVGGQAAVITVIGDRGSDLDLYVYDELGRLVAKDDDLTDRCVVAFTPAVTTTYKVRVVNRGVANRYTIRTN